MFFRIDFKIHIMKQPRKRPILFFFRITHFLRIPSHNAFYRIGVQEMERFFVIFLRRERASSLVTDVVMANSSILII